MPDRISVFRCIWNRNTEGSNCCHMLPSSCLNLPCRAHLIANSCQILAIRMRNDIRISIQTDDVVIPIVNRAPFTQLSHLVGIQTSHGGGMSVPCLPLRESRNPPTIINPLGSTSLLGRPHLRESSAKARAMGSASTSTWVFFAGCVSTELL